MIFIDGDRNLREDGICSKSKENILRTLPQLTFNQTVDDFDFGHSLDGTFTVVLSVILILISFGGTVFNLILIASILSKRSMRTTTNILIINLAIGDLITAVVTVPFDVDYLLRGYFPFGILPCAFKEFAFMLSLPSSVVNLSLLTIERYCSVKYPFFKIRHDNKRNIGIALVLGWTYSLAVATFPMMYDPTSPMVEYGHCFLYIPKSYQYYQVFVNFLVPLILILVLNGLMFSVAAMHANQILRQSQFRTITRTARISESLSVNIKAAKTVFTLVGIFSFSWIIFIALAIWNVLCDICHPREVTWSANAVNYSNIAVNPLVYGLLNKPIRKLIFQKLRINTKSRSKTFEEIVMLREGSSTNKIIPNLSNTSNYNESRL